METFETFLAIVLLILSILSVIMICAAILFGTLYHKSLLIQKLYVMLFDKDDYKLYKEIKEYLKDHKMQLIPHTVLSRLYTYHDDFFDKYIFAAFYNNNESYEVAIYDEDYTIRLTNFHNMLMQDLLKDAGYTQEDVDKSAIESEVRYQQLVQELEESQKELEELEKQLKQSK